MARLRSVSAFPFSFCVLILSTLMFLPGCGGNSGGGGGGGGGGQPPATPSGLTATAGNQQVALTWSASSGATSYHVKRGTVSGGPYSTVASPSTTSYTDTSLTNGTAYYYVVSAVNANGESGNSGEKSATPAVPVTGAQVTIDVLANRHAISPYVYGGAFPESATAIGDSGTTVVRWGGNAASTYNWQRIRTTPTTTTFSRISISLGWATATMEHDADSVKFITDVKAAGSKPLMTMVMLPWVAKEAENDSNGQLCSFSVAKYGAQCKVDPFNSDAGNGQKTGLCYATAGNDPNDAYFPLLDSHSDTCTGGNCVYRSDWAAATASGLGSGTCTIPYSPINSCHFYDMDNEIDIWGGTHFDIHPTQIWLWRTAGYVCEGGNGVLKRGIQRRFASGP